MKNTLFALILFTLSYSVYGQNDLVIKKTSDMKVPGMPDMSQIFAKNSSARAEGLRKARVSTVMVKGSRLRVDSSIPTPSALGTSVVSKEVSYIQQCDLGRTVHLNPKKKSYTISNIAGGGLSNTKAAEKVANAKKGGYVDVSMEVTDTNERRDMFGFVARHLKSTTSMTPGPNACMKQAMSFTDDGWYVDLPSYSCEIQPEDRMNSMQETEQDCVDEIRVKANGNMHLGFALQQTRTMSMNGMSVQVIENVISLERMSLDAGLFDIPPEYHQSGDSDSATVTAPATQTPQSPNTTANNPMYPPNWQNKALPQMVQMTDGSVPPKQPSVIRIGIITPTADMGQGFEGIDAGQIVQQAFLDKLKADKIEAVPISSGVLIQEEAKMKQCDYLLYADVKRKKGGGGFMKQMVLSNLAGLAGNAAGAAASAASSASMSGRLKNKDEITLEYHLNSSSGSSAIASTTLKKKAEKDGDDVLSPMIDEVSGNIISSLKTK
jgi:hypothetical protein